MRTNTSLDQAEGLRRLLVRNHIRVVTLVAGKLGVGRTSMATNLAAAMAHFGKQVLVLDENHAPHNVSAHLDLSVRYDLLDAIQSKCKPREAMLKSNGFFVLPTARAMHSLAQLKRTERQQLEDVLMEVSSDVDVILVDAAMPVLRQAEMSSSLVSGSSLLVVVDATISGITDSYALIKRLMHENASVQFEIVVNKVANEKVAMTVFGNMEKVAQRNLATRLEYFGYIPYDPKLQHTMQLGKSVIETYSDAPSTKSYLALSQRLLSIRTQRAESGDGVKAIMQNFVDQVAQPLLYQTQSVARTLS